MKWSTVLLIVVLFVVVLLSNCSKEEPVEIIEFIPVCNETTALEATHHGSEVKWIVPKFSDIKQCTDEELLRMAIFISIGPSANTADDFIYFGNKYMPERFRSINEDVVKINLAKGVTK